MSYAPVNLTPGPVHIRPEVRRAFEGPPLSHRSAEFVALLRGLRTRVAKLVRAPEAAVLLGSGTLANEAVAARLAAEGGRGLVLTNGEFGERLVEQARRWGIAAEVVASPWGAALDYGTAERRLCCRGVSWLWAVHCETSTGVLNDLSRLKTLAAERGVDLCVDAVSSIGAAPVDLRGVRLATGVSGKGLGGYPGLALVLADRALAPHPAVPRYLDLGEYFEADGVPFTFSSNLVSALSAALERLEPEQRQAELLARLADQGYALRTAIEVAGFEVLAPRSIASPVVMTISLPPSISSDAVGAYLERHGWQLSYRSGYLLRRNWIQICLMSDLDEAALETLPEALLTAANPGDSIRNSLDACAATGYTTRHGSSCPHRRA